MRSTGILAAAAAGMLVHLTTAGPASALDCAANPAATPQAIAAGAPIFDDGSGFFDHFDFGVVGTVVAIRTDERQGSPTYGATEVDLAVDGVLGVASAPDRLTLSAPDPGWMAGYGFEPGRGYFVPVLARGPEGQANWSSACDPITPVDDPEVAAGELRGLATDAGLAFGEPTGAPPPPSSGSEADGGASWFVPAVTATAVLAAGATALVLLRRRPQLVPR